MPLSMAKTIIAVETSAIDERGLSFRAPALATAQYAASAPIVSVTARIILTVPVALTCCNSWPHSFRY